MNSDIEIYNLLKTKTKLLKGFKGNDYSFGLNCLDSAGNYIKEFGDSTLLIISKSNWADNLRKKANRIFDRHKIKIIASADTAAPNNPVDDVYKIAGLINNLNPPSITCMGGGSAIDCVKAANALASVGSKKQDLEMFFGTNKITMLAREGSKKLYPFIAVQVCAGSAAHLTRYSNVTFTEIGQKKLMVDDILIPDRAVFDYSTTITAGHSLTLDGAMDGLSHAIEVYYGADSKKMGPQKYKLLEELCLGAISLIVKILPLLIKDLKNLKYREIIGIATDLGGYAIMLGGTNGPHLNSFSLTDILSHGRACAILNPYYTVFFSNSINEKLKKIINIFKNYIIGDKYINRRVLDKLSSRELGEIVGSAMINFYKKIGFPHKFSQIKGFSKKYIDKIIKAAKNPQLQMKLKNMPVPLNKDLIDKYMRPIIMAADSGDFSYIKTLNSR